MSILVASHRYQHVCCNNCQFESPIKLRLRSLRMLRSKRSAAKTHLETRRLRFHQLFKPDPKPIATEAAKYH